jgi:hypothetical protein
VPAAGKVAVAEAHRRVLVVKGCAISTFMYSRFRSFLECGVVFFVAEDDTLSIFLKGQRPVMVVVEGGGVLVLDAAAEAPLIKGRGRGLSRPLMVAQSSKRRWPMVRRH